MKIQIGGRGVKNLLLLLWAVLSPIMIQMLGIPSLLSTLGENLVSTSGFQNLRNTLVSPLDFFQLYFMPVFVDEIVQHTNAYAYMEVAKENSNKRCNTTKILRLIGLLIYFGFVDVKGSATFLR